ncbi:hypothetical protein ACXZ1M_23505 [Duganella sp. PWIR1]
MGIINGTDSADNLVATNGGDTLNGFGGNDVLTGGKGADVVNGGAGNDFINVRGGDSDTVDGGEGNDRVTYYSSAGQLVVDLEAGTADDGSGKIDHLSSIERISGSSGYADIITGRADTNETLYGNAGNDTLDGGVGGSDTTGYIFVTYGGSGVEVNLATGTSSGADGNDVLINFENIEGSNNNDTLTGDDGANIIWGFHGDDQLTGAGGNDTLIGAAGNDTAYYSGNRADYTLTTLANGDTLVQDNRDGSPDGTDTVRGVKTLQFADSQVVAVAQEQAVSSTLTGHQSFNVSAMLLGTGGGASTGYVTAFRAADANGEGIYVRLFDADGIARSSDLLVNTTTTGDQRAPVVSALTNGGFVVMWDSTPEAGVYTNPGLVEIKLQRFDADGNKLGGEVDVNTTTASQQRFPSVVSTFDNGFMTVWQSRHEGGGANAGIYGQKFDYFGNKVGGEVQINTTVAGNQLYPLVRQTLGVADEDGVSHGGLVAVWQGQLSNGSFGLAQQQFDGSGNKIGGEQIAYVAPAGALMNFVHQSMVDGGYVLSWVMTLADGSGAVMARTFNNDGSARAAAFTVATGDHYLGNDLILCDNGDVMIVWDVQYADGSSAIVGRNFNVNSGEPTGDLYLISDHANGGNVVYPTLSSSGNGDVVVSWNIQGNAIHGDSGGVYQQVINNYGEPQNGTFDTGATPDATSFTVKAVPGGDAALTDSTGHYLLGAALDSGDRVSVQHLALSGTAAFGTTVTIYSGDDVLLVVRPDDQGLWSADLKSLADGVYQLQAVVTDAFGHASAASAAFELTVQNSVIEGTGGDDNAAYWNANGANSSAQTLNGGDGNDTLNGGGGQDTLDGGAGNDTYIIVNGDEVIQEAAGQGTDTIVSSYGSYMPDNVENLTVTGNAAGGLIGNDLNNVLRGGSGGEYMNGLVGDDTLYGNAGNDNFDGSVGNDVEYGGDGDDFFIGGLGDSGNDLMDGGAGRDFFNLSTGQDTILGGAGGEDTLYTAIPGATHGVNINLATGAILDNGYGDAGSIGGIEHIEGTQFADSFTGSAADEDFYSHGGDDTIDGGAGVDAVIYGGQANFTGSLSTGTGSSSDGTIHFSNVEALGGGGGNDSLTGSAGNDILGGMLGNDTLVGLGGNDTLYGDGGNDTAVYRGNKADYIVSTQSDGSVKVQDKRTTGSTLDGTDTLTGVRTLKFADGTMDLKAVDQVVSSAPGGYQIYQSTAAHWYRDGGFVEVFRASDGSGDGLYVRAFDEDGNPKGGNILINAGNTGGDQRAPVVASLEFEGYVVAYHSNPTLGAAYDDHGWDVMVQVLNDAGNPVGAPVNVSNTAGVAQRLPSVAGLNYGGFAVAWQSAQAGEDGHLAVYARMFNSAGQPMGPEIQVGVTSDYNQSGPVITAQNDAGAVVTWSGITQDGHYGFIEQRFDGGGNKVGGENVVFTTPDATAQLSVVHSTRTADGGHVLSWIYDADGAGAGENVVMVRHYDATGAATGEAMVVASAGYQYSASVLGLSDGSYMVVWDAENKDGSSAIMGRRYGSDDSPLTGEFKISNTATAGTKLFPTLSEFQDGKVVVAWGTQGMAELTSSGGIYQQVIDFNGAPLFYAGDSSTVKPVAPVLTVQTVVGGAQPVLDPAYPSAAYYLKDAPMTSGASVSNSHVVVSGTAALGSSITVKDGATVLGTALVDDDGRWALDVKALGNGNHDLTAVVTDMFGKASAASAIFKVAINGAIAGTAGADGEAYWITRGANGNAQTLNGLDGNDTLNGAGGNDTLVGGGGDDVYIVNNTGVTITEAVGGGNDTVRTAVTLTLAANVENAELTVDQSTALTGNALNNILLGNDGNDTLNGGAGNDTMGGGDGDDTYVVDAVGDVVNEQKYNGVDTVQVAFAAAGTYKLGANIENAIATGTVVIDLEGNDQSNLLTGNSAGNKLDGGLGNDTLNGGAGNDTMAGGGDDDTYVVDAAGDMVTELADEGDDTVLTAFGAVTLAANVENLKYTGSLAFTGTGNAGANLIEGGIGADTLIGNGGNDTLKGGAGNDSLLGGEGDDVLMPSGGASGVDVVDGGSGDDTVVLIGDFNGFTRTRVTESDTKLVNAATGETVTIRNVEHVTFGNGSYDLAELIANSASPGADLIIGTVNDDVLDGGAGADTLAGSLGDDVYKIDNKDDVIQELADEGMDTAEVNLAAAGSYTLGANVENGKVTGAAAVNLIGNDLANTLTGNAAANTLTGNAGNDTLIGGAGNDTMIGGDGDDQYLVSDAGDVVTEAADGGLDKVVTGLASYTLAAQVEILEFNGSVAFTGTGNDLGNLISGGALGDKLSGMGGGDALSGGAGADTLDGGAGNDALFGGTGNDSLLGGADDDLLNAGTGVDVADGGTGENDVLELLGDYDSYAITRPNATDLVFVNASTGENITARNIEAFNFNGELRTYGQTILNKVSNFGDMLIGTLGNDAEIDGKGGADTMIGFDGDDTYIVDVAGDVIIENANEGNDTVKVDFKAAGTYTLGEEVENAIVGGTLAVGVTGNMLDNVLTGNAAANKLTGLEGNDTLNGGAGSDTLIGGDGDDVYVVDVATDVVTEAVEGGFDTVQTAMASYTLAANVEVLYFNGTVGFSGTGNALNNEIYGGTKADTLSGGAGNDTIYGGDGSDSLLGGEGDDVLYAGTGAGDVADGGVGSDTLVLSGVFEDYVRTRISATDTKLVNGATGESVIARNVETFVFTSSEETLGVDDINFNLASVGNDKLMGTDDNDSIDGGAGNDTMTGLLGDDIYAVDVATDVVVEAEDAGIDLVQVAFKTAGGTYVMAANVEYATVTGLVATNVTGNGLDNIITGNSLANKLDGGAGNDTLIGGAGIDTLIGGAGNDVYVVDVAGDVLTEALNGGTDSVETALASYTLGANIENLKSTAIGTLAFTGNGNALDNEIIGGAGKDTLNGGAGNDTLSGGAGDDSLLGGDGNDVLNAGTALLGDVVDGGGGNDILSLDGDFADYVRSRPNATDTKLVKASTGEIIILRNVETVSFDGMLKSINEVNAGLVSVGDDTLTGTSGADTINGGTGSDLMIGLEGNDTYEVDVATDTITELDGGGIDLVNVAFKAAGTYVLSSYVDNATVTAAATIAVNLTGNAQNNVLTGNAAANTLIGDAGDDTLDGGAGADKLTGGTGNDVYVVDVAGDVVTELADGGTDTVQTKLASYTLGANVENLVFLGTGAFTGTGNALANKLTGGVGNDSLVGGLGNDTLDAGTSGAGDKDVIDGGGDVDTLAGLEAFGNYKVSRPNATDTVLTHTSGAVITVRNVESFSFDGVVKTLEQVQDNVASLAGDNLTGTDGNDNINGGTGADTMAGGLGDDTYTVDIAGDVVTEGGDAGTDLVNVAYTTAGQTYTVGANVENATVIGTVATNLTGNALSNVLTGNAVANTLIGNEGNDTLIGGAGNDTMVGGSGDDVYVVDVATDVVTEADGAGTDLVQTTAAAYTLGAFVENLSYTGTAAFAGTGNALANIITGGIGKDTLSGGGGNDTLTGGAGDDSLLGGDGDDSMSAGTGAADVIDGGAGTDLVTVLGNFAAYTRSRVSVTETKLVNAATGESLTIRNVETVHFADGDKALADLIDNAASPGADTLVGTTGNDIINGLGGIDVMSGGEGDDIYVVDVAGDVVTELADEGTDLVQVAYTAAGSYTLGANVENGTVTGTLAIGIVGNELDNTLTGNAVANKLTGGLGNDTLIGGAGNDSLIGGDGDDVYVVDVAGDVVTELLNGGTDLVQTTAATYTLAANVENLRYIGSAAFTGTGNALDNDIKGGAGADKLNGGIGNDTLAGGLGNDTLTGGVGNDTFVLNSATGVDTITDFANSVAKGFDKLAISQAALTIGNGDAQVDGGVLRAAPGGFAADAELVIFSSNSGGITPAAAALVIGSANSGFTLGQQTLFVVDNNSASYVYLFKSSGTDALVSAGELTQIAIITGNPATTLMDYQFIDAISII